MDDEKILIEGELNPKDFFCSYDSIFIKVNGKQEFSFGKMNQMEFFNLLLADYLSNRQDIAFTYVCEQIKEYKNRIQKFSHEYNGEKIPSVFVNRYGGELELVAISAKGYRYYENGDEILFAVTDETGEPIATNPADYLQYLESENGFSYIADHIKARLEDN